MRFSPALAFVALASTSFADELSYSAHMPLHPVPGSDTVVLPKFDPDLGILTAVSVTVSGAVDGSLALENTYAQFLSIADYVGANLEVTWPSGGFPNGPNPAYETDPFLFLDPFDGTVDYGGSSGVTLPFTGATGTGAPSVTVDLFDPYAFGPTFVGPAGAPGTITISIASTGIQGGLPPGLLETDDVSVSADVEIVYTYDPAPAGMCFAAPWAPCPCNSGQSGYGCANSTNPDGGRLAWSGQSSVSADTLVLQGSKMRNSLVVYYQSTGMNYASVPYGDGRRCISGSLKRIGLKTNSGGASQYPEPGDPSISVRGAIPPQGGVRYYQAVYRDSAAFCLPATFNATNGVMQRWVP